jgi:hypothetical protein
MGSKKCGESDLRYQVECSMFQSENHFLLSAQQILHINQNHIRIPPHPLAWLPSRTQTTTSVGEDVGEKGPLIPAGGNANLYNHNRGGKEEGNDSK